MKEEDLKKYFDQLTEAWKFLRKHITRNPDKSDYFWNDVHKEATEIEEENGHSQFSVDLIIACMNELDRISKKEK